MNGNEGKIIALEGPMVCPSCKIEMIADEDAIWSSEYEDYVCPECIQDEEESNG